MTFLVVWKVICHNESTGHTTKLMKNQFLKIKLYIWLTREAEEYLTSFYFYHLSLRLGIKSSLFFGLLPCHSHE